MRLQDKVCIITGAGSGMGRVATRMFCEQGARVVAADVVPDAGEEAVAVARETGKGEATPERPKPPLAGYKTRKQFVECGLVNRHGFTKPLSNFLNPLIAGNAFGALFLIRGKVLEIEKGEPSTENDRADLFNDIAGTEKPF